MPLPISFQQDGLVSPKKGKYRRIMIGTDGDSETGKTEFIASAPGPGIILCLDRGYEAMLDNANPPKTRNPDFAYVPVQVPLATSKTQADFVKYWQEFYSKWVKATENRDALTIGLDGDSDS